MCIDADDADNPLDFEMTGGTIQNNQAQQKGRGVFIVNGTIDLRGSAEVKGNRALLGGGGICAENSAFRINGMVSIRNNTLSAISK